MNNYNLASKYTINTTRKNRQPDVTAKVNDKINN